MQIENNLLNISMSQSDRVQTSSTSDGRTSSRVQQPAGGADAVDLGSQAGLVATAQSAGQDDRLTVVQQLRAIVQSGQYQVDTPSLSASIINATLSGY